MPWRRATSSSIEHENRAAGQPALSTAERSGPPARADDAPAPASTRLESRGAGAADGARGRPTGAGTGGGASGPGQDRARRAAAAAPDEAGAGVLARSTRFPRAAARRRSADPRIQTRRGVLLDHRVPDTAAGPEVAATVRAAVRSRLAGPLVQHVLRRASRSPAARGAPEIRRAAVARA